MAERTDPAGRLPAVDLNGDVGEGAGWPVGDLELIELVTSVNIACGGHAGDAETMKVVCAAAAQAGVAVGAHPGYPDRERFGRHETGASTAEIEDLVAGQVEELIGVAEGLGARVDHVKPHGALYHRCWFDPEAAGAAVTAVAEVAAGAAILAPPASELERAARAAGLDSIAEGFVDRAYSAGGLLVPRSSAGATLGREAAAAQAVALAAGSDLAGGPVRSLCIHGDGDGAALLARTVVDALALAGVG
ncbi:MAG: LamB/YcsF family protein, partial [Actinomycetes bacterium]